MSQMKKIPAIRGQIGNTIYYLANMTFGDLTSLVHVLPQEQLFNSASIKDALQRSLTDNVSNIKEYILSRNDFFFNALVLAVYGGNPIWREVAFDIEDNRYYNLGLLELSGTEKIFPIDGQHRLEGIREAIKHENKLSNQTIPIILIGHECTPIGVKRTRRIFSTLNRYAKPVLAGDIIALDEDDVVAISTRNLLESHILFSKNNIRIGNSKSIPVSDKKSFTTLITLYACCNELFCAFYFQYNGEKLSKEKLDKKKHKRPSEQEIDDFTQYLSSFWDKMMDSFVSLYSYASDESNTAALKYRPQGKGGNLLFRPAGLLPLISAISRVIIDTNDSFDNVINRYCSILNLDVSSDYWTNVLWDARNGKMLSRDGNQKLAKYLLLEMYSSDILQPKECTQMEELYVKFFNVSADIAKSEILERYSILQKR